MNTNHLDEFSVTLLSNASIDIYSRNNVYDTGFGWGRN